MFSSPRDFDCENQVSIEGFLKTFKKVFFVTKKGVVPGFLKRFQINIIPGSLESGFWSKREGVLVLSENDFSGEYSQYLCFSVFCSTNKLVSDRNKHLWSEEQQKTHDLKKVI